MRAFDFALAYHLENEYVRLEPLEEAHYPKFSEFAGDDEIWEYLLEDGSTEEKLLGYLREAVNERRSKTAYPFAAYDKRSNNYAGTTRLYDFNFSMRNVKVGHTWYGSVHRGSHINASVKFLIFDFVFRELKFERIGFGVHAENGRSISALRKVGCQEEGVLRSFLYDAQMNRFSDLTLLSMLRSEWEARHRLQLWSRIEAKEKVL